MQMQGKNDVSAIHFHTTLFPFITLSIKFMAWPWQALAKVPPKFLGSHVCPMIRQPRPAKDHLGKIECNFYNRMLAQLPRKVAKY